MHGEQRVGVGADAVEGDVAEVEQAAQPDDHVEPQAQADVDQDVYGHVLGVAVGEHGVGQGEGGQGHVEHPARRARERVRHGVARPGQGREHRVEDAPFAQAVEHEADGGGPGHAQPDQEGFLEVQAAVADAHERPQQQVEPGQAQPEI